MSYSVISIVGPTASGKSDLAISLALQLAPAEIINTDAMQLYQGMDIGTAKLTTEQMRGIPHHLISAVAPDRDVSAVEYRDLFDSAYEQISSRNAQVLTVGGSTLYLAAALDQLQFAPTDEEVRGRLEGELAEQGQLTLWERLERIDPATAAKIPASNPRRVIRALEVIELTGKPYPNTLPDPVYRRKTLQLGISVPRDVLNERIAMRVREMWDAGIVQETERLIKVHGRLSRTALRAIGYQQAIDQLAGRISAEEAIEQTIQLTTRYAKKQMTWFRRDNRIVWLDFSEDLVLQALEQIRLVR